MQSQKKFFGLSWRMLVTIIIFGAVLLYVAIQLIAAMPFTGTPSEIARQIGENNGAALAFPCTFIVLPWLLFLVFERLIRRARLSKGQTWIAVSFAIVVSFVSACAIMLTLVTVF